MAWTAEKRAAQAERARRNLHTAQVHEKLRKSWTDSRREDQADRARNNLHTETAHQKLSASLQKFYATDAGKQTASVRSRENWKRDKGKMREASQRNAHRIGVDPEITSKARSSLLAWYRTPQGRAQAKKHAAFMRTLFASVRGQTLKSRYAELRRQEFLQGVRSVSVAKKGVVPTVKGGVQPYRSLHELAAFLLLDADSSVKSFEYEVVRLPYAFEGQVRVYVVDLLVEFTNGGLALLEVKPTGQTKNPVNRAKESAARAMCSRLGITFAYITTRDLGSALLAQAKTFHLSLSGV